jgi:hypothetical protein
LPLKRGRTVSEAELARAATKPLVNNTLSQSYLTAQIGLIVFGQGETKMMILIERISAFLREFPSGCYCDECLREMLDVSSVSRVARFTSALARSPEFRGQLGNCTLCGRQALTIQAASKKGSHPLHLVDIWVDREGL